MLEQGPEMADTHLSASEGHLTSLTSLRGRSFLMNLLKSWRDSVDEILNSSFGVVESSSKGSNALLSCESHVHKFCDLGLVLGILGRFGLILLFLLLLGTLLFFFLLFGSIDLGFLLGLGCGFGDLVHANNKIGVLDAQFVDRVLIVEGFSLKDHFKGLCRHTLGLLNFIFEGGNLSTTVSTLSSAYTSTSNTSPFRFLTFSFIQS